MECELSSDAFIVGEVEGKGWRHAQWVGHKREQQPGTRASSATAKLTAKLTSTEARQDGSAVNTFIPLSIGDALKLWPQRIIKQPPWLLRTN